MKDPETPLEVAIRLIEVYVLRGDSVIELRQSWMGSGCKEYSSTIGGYVNGKKYSNDKIVVTRCRGKDCLEVFSLQEIFNLIKEKEHQLVLF